MFLRVGGEGRVVGIQMSRIGDVLFEISQPRLDPEAAEQDAAGDHHQRAHPQASTSGVDVALGGPTP